MQSCKRQGAIRGKGFLNKIINTLPVELHLPGYQYCGPGTKLQKRLKRGDPGINGLDAACKEHDIVYSQNRENIEKRNQADKVLAEKAWERVLAGDSGIGEKVAAWSVTNAMKAKAKLGMGVRKDKKKKKKKIALREVINSAKTSMKSDPNVRKVIQSALKGAREAVRSAGGRKNVNQPRILPVPKVGGVLPFLIPLFAGLSALGALTGGAAGVAKAVIDAQSAKKKLEETQRHNQKMEDIAVGKGLYLKPYKQGLGLCMKPKNLQ